MSNEYRVLEFFSGIGGMHYALQATDKKYEVLQAFDINEVANKVYSYNLNTPVSEANLDSITAKKLNKFNANLFLMSPPCQPYTRTGVQLADKDPRAKSFLNFLKLLPDLKTLNYFLIENVQGFENSPTHALLIKACEENGFKYQQFLLNPLHLGIPNSRLRFYFLAKRNDLPDFKFQELNDIIFHSDKESNDLSKLDTDSFQRAIEWFKLTKNFNSTLNDYLGESLSKVELLDLRSIPEKTFDRYYQVYDIVTPESTGSCCFTKGYSSYAEATGSILKINTEEGEKFRYFDSMEIAKLMGFPEEFKFPNDLTFKVQCRLLGNSLNVKVVAKLLEYLLD